jgi:uncharacterized OB-fold protein
MSAERREPRMIAPGLVRWGASGPQLIAGRRSGVAGLVFPAADPAQSDIETVVLSSRGTLWSWTVQRFEPRSPPYRTSAGGGFEPYLVGYVEFPEGLIVEGRIVTRGEEDALRVGELMETIVIPLFVDETAEPVHIFAFRPLA